MMKYAIVLGLSVVVFTYSHANVPAVTSTVDKVQKNEPAFFALVKDKIKKTWHSMTKKEKVILEEQQVLKKVEKKKVTKDKKIVHKAKKKKIQHKKKSKATKHLKKKVKLTISKVKREDIKSEKSKIIPIDKVAIKERKRVEKAERRRRAKRIEEERKIAMRLKKIAEDMRKSKPKKVR